MCKISCPCSYYSWNNPLALTLHSKKLGEKKKNIYNWRASTFRPVFTVDSKGSFGKSTTSEIAVCYFSTKQIIINNNNNKIIINNF